MKGRGRGRLIAMGLGLSLLLGLLVFAFVDRQPAGLASIRRLQVDNGGAETLFGANQVVILDPRSADLDFKVVFGLADPLYAKDAQGKLIQNYFPRRFGALVTGPDAQLDGQMPFAAINGDYIDPVSHPQGLNVSRGVEYSGDFKAKRSSLAISGGPTVPLASRAATIQVGPRPTPAQQFNAIGGNGRFYTAGQFKDICADLGEYACHQETQRTMAAVTAGGWVILLVNNAPLGGQLFPDQFGPLLSTLADRYHLGPIQDAMLMDGGASTGLYYDGKIVVENANPMGSVLLIYWNPTHG
jgi:hypothetical protein